MVDEPRSSSSVLDDSAIPNKADTSSALSQTSSTDSGQYMSDSLSEGVNDILINMPWARLVELAIDTSDIRRLAYAELTPPTHSQLNNPP